MNTEVFIRDSQVGLALHLGAEVIDEWEGGRLIRAEQPLQVEPRLRYYVVEGDHFVAVTLPPTGQQDGPPFDYTATLDPSDRRPFPADSAGHRGSH